jgi:hypothetical protein
MVKPFRPPHVLLEGSRNGRVRAGWDLGKADGFGNHHELGEAAISYVVTHQYPEDLVSFFDTRDASADRFDGSREVFAENDRETMLHHPFDHSACDCHIESVDGRMAHPYEYLARSGLGNGKLVYLGGNSEITESNSTHLDLPWWITVSSINPPPQGPFHSPGGVAARRPAANRLGLRPLGLESLRILAMGKGTSHYAMINPWP